MNLVSLKTGTMFAIVASVFMQEFLKTYYKCICICFSMVHASTCEFIFVVGGSIINLNVKNNLIVDSFSSSFSTTD